MDFGIFVCATRFGLWLAHIQHALFLFRHSCSTSLFLRKGCNSEIWLDDLEVREHLLGLVVLDTGVDNHVITRDPVDGSSDFVLVAGLQGVHDAKNLSSIATGRRGVGEDGTDDLLGVDDENGSNCERNALLVDIGRILIIQHVVLQSNLPLLVTDDGELEVAAADLVDIINPFPMTVDCVCR